MCRVIFTSVCVVPHRHPYFKNLSFDKLLHGKYQSPYQPTVKGPGDASNFSVNAEEDKKVDNWTEGKDDYGDIFTDF